MHIVALFLMLAQSAGEVAPRTREAPAREAQERTVPRMADAAAQLAHARRLKRAVRTRAGPELAARRQAAVAAYRAVREFHPDARSACVEAAFRAGELLRASGDEPGALTEFAWAAGQGERSAFRARALLEIGHLHRHASRWRAALEAYLEVAGDADEASALREDAWLWAGTSWKALGLPEEARGAWRRVAEHGSDPLARVRAFDELALALVEESELEGAAGVLDQCLRALSASALEETEQGTRVRNALARMRVVDELARALAQRRAADVARGTRRKS